MTIAYFQIANALGDRQPARYTSEHAAIAAASQQLTAEIALMIWAMDVCDRPVEVRGKVVFYDGSPSFFSANTMNCRIPSFSHKDA